MNYETKLAAALGSIPTNKTEKLSYDLSKLSIEELDKLASVDGESFVDSAAEEILSLEKVAMADSWGRELARAEFEKTALLGPMPGLKGLLSPVSKSMIPTAGKAMNWAAQGAGKNIMHGAIGGGALGAAKGLISDPGIDPQTGQNRSRIQAAMSGAIGGAALGAGAAGAAGAGLRAAGASQTATGKYLNASQRIVNRSAAGKAQQAATAAANPAAAAAAAGRSPPTPESMDRLKKLQADMAARREAENVVGKGLNPQEQAARLKAGKGSQVGGMKSELMPEIANPNPAAEYAQRVTSGPQPESAGQALSGMKGMTPERQAQIEARMAATRARESGSHAATPEGTEAAIRANAARLQAQAQNRTPMGAMRNLASRITGPGTGGVMASP